MPGDVLVEVMGLRTQNMTHVQVMQVGGGGWFGWVGGGGVKENKNWVGYKGEVGWISKGMAGWVGREDGGVRRKVGWV